VGLLSAIVTPGAYGTAVGLALVLGIVLCVEARRRPGPWRVRVAQALGVVLLADVVSYIGGLVVAGTFSARTDLPLPLCDATLLAAAGACLWRAHQLVELTYYLGMAGTLKAIATPDLSAGFPHLVFFEYLVGHLGVVLAALFLVVGMGLRPRPGAVPRALVITASYTAVVGLVDAVTGANYMFLRRPPGEWTLLRLLGPWPWYTLSAAGVAVVLLVLLDLPFRLARRHRAGPPAPPRPAPPGLGATSAAH
jgi:hypothetical integral membrane protein (TIGR02206 family)